MAVHSRAPWVFSVKAVGPDGVIDIKSGRRDLASFAALAVAAHIAAFERRGYEVLAITVKPDTTG